MRLKDDRSNNVTLREIGFLFPSAPWLQPGRFRFGHTLTPEQSLRELAAHIGRHRFTSHDAYLDFVLGVRQRLLALANQMSARPQEPIRAPSVVDRYLGRRQRNYALHELNNGVNSTVQVTWKRRTEA